jgi:hypothetical protein
VYGVWDENAYAGEGEKGTRRYTPFELMWWFIDSLCAPCGMNRAMAKLREQAEKTKIVLSANPEMPVTVSKKHFHVRDRSMLIRSSGLFLFVCAHRFPAYITISTSGRS